MKFKEFSNWCNDRACDGCWGLNEAIICCNLAEDIYKLPFWKREKKWKEVEDEIVTNIINPTNKKIDEIINKNKEGEKKNENI